jgi:hypothetical protein
MAKPVGGFDRFVAVWTRGKVFAAPPGVLHGKGGLVNYGLFVVPIELGTCSIKQFLFPDVLREIHAERPNGTDLLLAIEAEQQLAMLNILQAFMRALFFPREGELALKVVPLHFPNFDKDASHSSPPSYLQKPLRGEGVCLAAFDLNPKNRTNRPESPPCGTKQAVAWPGWSASTMTQSQRAAV